MWIVLFYLYDNIVWFCVLFTTCLVLFIVHLLSFNEREVSYYRSLQNCAFTIYSMSCGKDFVKIPRTIHLRIILASYGLCTVVLFTLGASSIAEHTINPRYEKTLHLDDLLSTNLVFASSSYAKQYLKVYEEITNSKRKKPYKTCYCENPFFCYDILKKYR